jgi:hypothetical protein
VLARDAAVARMEETLSVSQGQCRDLSRMNTELQQALEQAQANAAACTSSTCPAATALRAELEAAQSE